MGETKPGRIVRAVCAAALVAAAATALTSCSALGMTPGSAVSSAGGPVLDPSVPSVAPTDAATTATPVPTATPVATVDPTTAPAPTAAPLKAVVPFITTADWDSAAKAMDVSAIVPGIIEGGGTCTVTLTSGASTRSGTGDGVAASSYTGCEAVTFKNLAAGTWQVRVRYTSSKAAGSSAVHVVQVG